LRYYERHSRLARAAYRLAILCLAVFAGTFVWHRFFGLATPLALKIFGGAVLASVLSLTLAGAALVKIWNDGSSGAVRASAAVFLSLLVLAIPLWSLPKLLKLPRLYDISTDLTSPPAYDRVSKIRQGQANPVHYDLATAPLQAAAYPDIKPFLVAGPLPIPIPWYATPLRL